MIGVFIESDRDFYWIDNSLLIIVCIIVSLWWFCSLKLGLKDVPANYAG